MAFLAPEAWTSPLLPLVSVSPNPIQRCDPSWLGGQEAENSKEVRPPTTVPLPMPFPARHTPLTPTHLSSSVRFFQAKSLRRGSHSSEGLSTGD